MSRFALAAGRIFDGELFHEDSAVIIDGARIAAVAGRSELDPGLPLHDLGSGILAPGFVDLQVNGGGGVLFNARPDVDGLRAIASAHRRFGTTGLLPTIITDAPEVLQAGVAAVRAARAQRVPGILGLHAEGPFIDPARRGAHPEQFIRPMRAADVEWLSAAACGTLLLTLSPAHATLADITRLARAGIIVSLGHSDASAAQALAALAAGARGFTHLYNAMSQLGHRAPGMVGAALSHRDSFCGLIADGFHVDAVALRAAINAKSPDSLVLVSDAMPPAAGGPDQFELQGRRVSRRNGRLQLDDGTLAGCNLTMDAALRHAVQVLGVPLEQALRMASLNPARFIRLDHLYGRIRPGYLASLVHLGDDLGVRASWIDGGAESKAMPGHGGDRLNLPAVP